MCPYGETCRMGACVPADAPDAAFVGLDASFEGVDGGGEPFPDVSYGLDGGASDGGRRRGGGSSGCGCRTHGTGALPTWQLAALVMGLALVWRRRR